MLAKFCTRLIKKDITDCEKLEISFTAINGISAACL